MVIIITKEGQLANRIWQLNAYILNARKHGYKVYHLFFDEYFDLFSESLAEQTDFPVHFIRRWLPIKLLRKVRWLLRKLRLSNNGRFADIVFYDSYEDGHKTYDLNSPVFVQNALNKVVFLQGWFFGEDMGQREDRELLQKIWTPNRIYREHITRILRDIRQNADIVVGVHIRRGDYATFNNGIWYFDNAAYKHFLSQFTALPEFAGKRVHFIICSNEPVDQQDFDGLHVHIAQRHFIEDLYLLAAADYIMGPPSTYSMWASYYGEKPLYMIMSAAQTMQLTDFRQIDNFPQK